ncbi:MAG: hypothetical protein G01um10148_917 [Parcubacteria group bacterium Gr01-1014_8]|nr:MAG: hypothetical protein G01um10148_917 [Parcubacteria group bacterium Gr01-1014_8]
MPEGVLSGQFVTTLMWVMFVATAALSIILGIILSYHWVRFSMNAFVATFAVVIYAGGCFLFLSTMFAAIIALS